MTQTQDALADYGRWPGYTEQSWQQRFAELDRRHSDMLARFEAHLRSTSPDPRYGKVHADGSRSGGQPPSPAGEVGEIAAYRYDFDGYGWKYIDGGSGSDWRGRALAHPDAEPLFERLAASDTEAMRLLLVEAATQWRDRQSADLLARIDALAKGGAA